MDFMDWWFWGGVTSLTVLVSLCALAAFPTGMLLRRLGFSPTWAMLLFLLLLVGPFIPRPLNLSGILIPPLELLHLDDSALLVVVPGLLQFSEWAPALAFVWWIALRRSGSASLRGVRD